MIEVNVYEYVILFVLAVVGWIPIGWIAGKWIGKQLVRAYIFIFGIKLQLSDASKEKTSIRLKGRAAVKLADAVALAKEGE